MKTLRENVERARLQRGKLDPTLQQGTEENGEKEGNVCRIECAEYEWGSDVSHLLLSVFWHVFENSHLIFDPPTLQPVPAK